MTHLFGFISAAILVIVVPGPATFFVLSQTNMKHALRAVSGIVSGDILLIGLAYLGVASALHLYPQIHLALRLFGAGYLLVLAWQFWHTTPVQIQNLNAPEATRPSYLQGLLLTLSNPKPILFFAGFFPLFLSTHYAWEEFLNLGLWFEAINLLYFSFIILLASKIRRSRRWHTALPKVASIAMLVCVLFVAFPQT